MDDPLSRGLPFELADIWRRSTLETKDGQESLFPALDASFPSLDLDILLPRYEDELVIPPLDEQNGLTDSAPLEPSESDIASPPSELWDTGQPSPDDAAAIWDLDPDLCLPPDSPRIHTWEAFEKKDVANAERAAYLSEAGPNAFDAVLARHNGKSSGVLPQDVMLRALCNLALGRASVFFQWDEVKSCFMRTLEDVPISGYSPVACNSFIRRLMDYATHYRKLRAHCTAARPRRLVLQCAVAFYGSASNVLDAVEEHITHGLGTVRSILQLQGSISGPMRILHVLSQLYDLVRIANTDGDIISGLSDRVHQLVSANSYLSGILRSVLQRTSAPWLEKLAVDTGLADDPTLTAEDASTDDDSADKAELDVSIPGDRATSDAVVGVMSSEDRRLIDDTKTCLRVLFRSLPQHAIFSEAPRRLFREAIQGREGAGPGFREGQIHLSMGNDTVSEPATMHEDTVWTDQDAQHDYLAQIDVRMSSLCSDSQSRDDSLHSAVQAYFSVSDSPSILSTALTVDLSPLDLIRPALSAQNKHLNRTLLTHLFNSNLTHHLILQHALHFLGSGEFVTRLCTALFSTETQSAERKRGKIPTGQTMGLRLGASRGGQRWPPASSELRLTLMDVLAETYKNDYPDRATVEKDRGVKEALPGGFSFSIRELPEHEIERVMNANSIYALDFLRLQYATPAPLDAIVTSAAMQVYDSIFRQLLRLLRVLHSTSHLQRSVSSRHQKRERSTPCTRFTQQAHIVISTLFSHTIDAGITAPWRTFMHSLHAIEGSTKTSDTDSKPVVGLQDLRQMHAACLETIRGRLFLRRNQEKLRLAIGKVLSAVLQGVGMLEQGKEENQAVKDLNCTVKELLALLRREVDRPPKATSVNDGHEDDVEMMRILLMKLDWNGFYEDTSSIA